MPTAAYPSQRTVHTTKKYIIYVDTMQDFFTHNESRYIDTLCKVVMIRYKEHLYMISINI